MHNYTDMNTEGFIETATRVHNGRYLYDRVEIKGPDTSIEVKCEVHGYFKTTPREHLEEVGCKECSFLIKMVKEMSFV